jgi:hypothetical protein
VTIPTEVALAETQRLLLALQEQRIAVRRVIVNQVIPSSADVDDASSNAKLNAYLDRLRLGQTKSIGEDENRIFSSSMLCDGEANTYRRFKVVGRASVSSVDRGAVFRHGSKNGLRTSCYHQLYIPTATIIISEENRISM